jgi:glycine dehydrogenase
MLDSLGCATLEDFISKVVPPKLRLSKPLALSAFPAALSEADALRRIRSLANQNIVARSFIGCGYYDCLVPTVIQRNILENPGWYTQYTPYQAEIAQGRLEALLNFQTMVTNLTGLAIANSSLLDEGTAAAEAMAMAMAIGHKNTEKPRYLVSSTVHPQTVDVVVTRAKALGVEVTIARTEEFNFSDDVIGCLVQYPDTTGNVVDLTSVCDRAHAAQALVCVATDLLALTILKSPGAMGADMAIGSAQRFGVPMGYGGPHAAFFATKDQYKRSMPGRLVGVSKDAAGKPALRLSLQTREQHIRREKATSNICTAQVLLAVMASMYAVYHGPDGLRRIAKRVLSLARAFRSLGADHGLKFVTGEEYFDTVVVDVGVGKAASVCQLAEGRGMNLRQVSDSAVGVSFDEAKSERDVADLLAVFGVVSSLDVVRSTIQKAAMKPVSALTRNDDILPHTVFRTYHSETEFLRYVTKLQSRDLSLAFSMIPLGSCTMKLNATSEMVPVTWPEFGGIHPFAPRSQTRGYQQLFRELETALAEVTGFFATSLQPNSGAQGEYAGLLVIRAYQASKNEHHRDICIIPRSAHGTNPASAAMAGLEVVSSACDAQGNVDLDDLKAQVEKYKDRLSCLMITYPSTHGVFEDRITEACAVVHAAGGQVYMDGANLNALVGLTQPAIVGADVCHINLHKTFCIPHGGGGPGMGPICVASHLAPFLPGHCAVELGHRKASGAVSAAPWGSASILPISWMYMAMMGGNGLTRATEIAILNANYIAKRLAGHYGTLYRGGNGFVAHECILDLRPLKEEAGIEVEDVAKRLMDYGFHAPTVSWPVAGTLMVEPTESESKEELDRFCDAMIQIRQEVRDIASGKFDRKNNPLKNAPHTAESVVSDSWNRPYSRELAAFPAAWTRESKFWPSVGRIDGVYGDRNLMCTCSA